MKQTQSGFTLIELMVVVAIVGILAAIAVPSYQDSVRKSHRADAKAALMGLANAMERHFTETNTYCDVGGTGGADTGCGDSTLEETGLPSGIYAVPAETSVNYNIRISSANANSYTLNAAPVGTSAQAYDKCGTLSLNNVGQRDAVKDGTSIPDCW